MRQRNYRGGSNSYWSKEKIDIEEEIFHKHSDEPFTWADIKHVDFKDTDKISLQYVDAYYSENNSYDAHFSASVTRYRQETDEEFDERQKDLEKQRAQLKERRRENYLKLKAEFEPETITKPGFGSGGG
jgi:hypothetical protein